MKPGPIRDPDIYLVGGKLTQFEVEDPATPGNSQLAWGLSSTKYVQIAIANVEEYCSKNFLVGNYQRNMPNCCLPQTIDQNLILTPNWMGNLTAIINCKLEYSIGWSN